MAFLGVLPWSIRAEEPKAFLVVLRENSQTVVDMAAWRPDRNDAMKTIATVPKAGVVSWTGARLAFGAEVPGRELRAVHVRDLLATDDGPPFEATGPLKALELIGWLGEANRLVIRDREFAAGYMLRAVGARLAKDSVIEPNEDITPEPGVYKYAATTRTGAVAFYRVRGNDRGQVVVWQAKRARVIAEDVAASELCWSPDAARLAVAELGKVTIIDVADPTKRTTHPLPPGSGGDPARIGSMAWRPDGAAIALLPDWPDPDHFPRNPRVWSLDPETGNCIVLVNLTEPARSVRWLDGTGCDTSLDEACALAGEAVVGRRP